VLKLVELGKPNPTVGGECNVYYMGDEKVKWGIFGNNKQNIKFYYVLINGGYKFYVIWGFQLYNIH
jgi:hypothetical protein